MNVKAFKFPKNFRFFLLFSLFLFLFPLSWSESLLTESMKTSYFWLQFLIHNLVLFKCLLSFEYRLNIFLIMFFRLRRVGLKTASHISPLFHNLRDNSIREFAIIQVQALLTETMMTLYEVPQVPKSSTSQWVTGANRSSIAFCMSAMVKSSIGVAHSFAHFSDILNT